MATVDIRLNRVDRVFRPGDLISGAVIIQSKSSIAHSGITLHLEGEVELKLSAKSVGVFEAFYNSLKPIKLIDYKIEICKADKIAEGGAEIPFEFKLEPLPEQQLYDTYHGVFVTIGYTLGVEVVRKRLNKNLVRQMEFIVEVPKAIPVKETPVEFTVKPTDLENVKKASISKIPKFEITGKLKSATCDITKPFLGELTVQNSDSEIRSIELQLVRVETCGCADGFAKEATEIQNIQICDGDVCRGLSVPIYMIFPRLFTCPTTAARTFKIEFEVNLVVMFADGHLLSQNFPIQIVRSKQLR